MGNSKLDAFPPYPRAMATVATIRGTTPLTSYSMGKMSDGNHIQTLRWLIPQAVVVGVSFISRFRLRPLMGMCQEGPSMYLS